MTLCRALVLGFLLVLAGCGGGGGGGGGSSGGGNGGGNGGGTAPPPPPPPPPPPSGNGSAEIVFPSARSAATAPTITVRGIAADPEGVANVLINGVPATLTLGAVAASRRPLAAKAALAEGEVEWSAEIELTGGDNELTITVEDADGELSEDVASSTISYVEVPVNFDLDTNAGRLVGLSFTLTPAGYVQHLVQHDFATGEQEVFDELPGDPALTCFRAVENHFIYLSEYGASVRELRSYDLATREDELLFELPADAFNPGPGFEPSVSTAKLECDSNHTSAYLLVNFIGESSNYYEKSRVIEIPLSGTGIGTLWETDASAPEPWIVTNIALAAETLVAQQDFNSGEQPLLSISLLNDQTATELAPLDVWGFELAPALELDRVYVATFQGVDEVDLTGPTKRNISAVDANDPLTFSQVRAIGFDPANSRVLVGDSDLDAVIAVDLATGERSQFISHFVGEGAPLIAPRAFALTADGTRAYVADDGSNAVAKLFEIDLTTGDRTIVGDISTAISNFATGLALDEAAGRVFVSGQEEVIEVDLATGAHETIVDVATTDLESIRDLLLDPQGGRLLIGDPVGDGLYSLDLVTRDLAVISREGVRGSGPAFGDAISMTRVGTSNELYVAGQNSGRVTRVDLATGDREELAHDCETAPLAILDQVLYGEARHELLISGDQLFSFDLETGHCTELPRRDHPLQIQVTPADQLLAVSFRTLMQIDRATGEIVIISK